MGCVGTPAVDYDGFLKELYGCKFCVEQRRPFAIPTPDGMPRRGWNKFRHNSAANAPHKFPPIGFGNRSLLFLAINPRFTANSAVHAEVMSSLRAFESFAQTLSLARLISARLRLLAVKSGKASTTTNNGLRPLFSPIGHLLP